MLKWLKDVWDFLSGKKTIIAAIAGQVIVWMAAKGTIDLDTLQLLANILSIWTGVAVSHKLVKGVTR